MSNDVEIERLRESTLVRDLDEDQCNRLAARLQVAELADGEVLVRHGEEDHRLFILARGSLEVIASPHGGEEVMHVMRPGECAGTRAFIDRSPRQATLRAHGEASVYWLSPEDFEALVDSDPWLVYRVMCAIFRITHVNLLRMNTEARELANYVTKTHGRY